MGIGARSQLLGGMEPIFVWRSMWTAPRSPKFVREHRDVIVSERGDDVATRSPLSLLMCLLRVLESLSGMFMARQVILLSVRFSNAMGVCGNVV